MKKLVATLVVLGVLGGAGFWYYRYSTKPTAPTVTTAAVSRGDIVESIGATGTLQAVTTVQVGSQVSGNISYLGADFNSLVKKGQVLARLDPSLFEAQSQQSKANLAQARANLTKSKSDLDRNKVELVDAQQKYTRALALSARTLIPQSDLDSAKTAVNGAEASVASQEATVIQTQAAITQAEAAVNQNQVNLDHTVITAPIDGLVISRSVDVGQTVAASMQAPTLFVMAADLTKMQVVANLDESDVGRIRPNQTVSFRVDAYPGETFHGVLSQVRLQPITQQNVVTYATVINVANNDLRLKPGMTANVTVEISRAANVLRVPNSAIRYRPSNDVFTAFGQTPPEPQRRAGAPGTGRRGNGAGGAAPSDEVPTPAPGAAAKSGPASTATAAAPAAAPTVAPAPSTGRGGPPAVAGAAPADQSDSDRRARFAERLQNMSPAEREAFQAGRRGRGDGSATAGRGGGAGPSAGSGARGSQAAAAPAGATGARTGASPTPAASGATTIDALFAPLARTESVGRAWIFVDKKLTQIRLRLGISDGQNTELIEGDLHEGSDVVTNVAIAGQTTRPAATAFPGFGQPGRGGFPGGGAGGRGGGR